MARGRMISFTLGRSKKYNALPDDFTKLVYIHALTGADEKGRIEADAVSIYGDHFVIHPDASLERIEAALAELHRVGLIQLYEVDGKRYARFADFEKHNTIWRKKDGTPQREGVSRIPAPPDVRVDPAPDRAPTAQEVRSDRADPYIEVQDQVEDQVEVEETSSREMPMGGNPSALQRLRRKSQTAFKQVEIQGGQLGWKFRHKNLAAEQVLERGEDALRALAMTHKAANKSGASAYTYFERVLAAPRVEPGERVYEDVDGGDLLGIAPLNGTWGPS